MLEGDGRDFRPVRIFGAVAERQHVTHAAEALNLAQSAASHAIASLEDRHQTKLFHRIGRHIELTDAGQAFLKEARAVLATVEAAELALIEFSNLKRGVLSVQASQTIANYWLPRHLAAFREYAKDCAIHRSPKRPKIYIWCWWSGGLSMPPGTWRRKPARFRTSRRRERTENGPSCGVHRQAFVLAGVQVAAKPQNKSWLRLSQ